MAVEDQVVVIYAATNGFVDRISADRVPEFHAALIDRMRAEHADVLERIGKGEWDDDITATVHDAVDEFAKDFGADLDEDGVPVDGDSGSGSGERASAESADDADGETADEPEKEAAPACRRDDARP
jgi:F-type H+-transporting ATPase subunit alpha